jgi:outer membrane protein OmpA-like peptidoglycan-associated protein
MAPKDDTYDMVDTSPDKRGGGKLIGVIAALLALLVVGGGAGYYLLKGRSSDDTANNNSTINRTATGTTPASTANNQASTASANTTAGTANTGSGAANSNNANSATASTGGRGSGTNSNGSGGAGTSGSGGSSGGDKEVVHFDVNGTRVMGSDAGRLQAFWSKIRGQQGTINVAGYTDGNGSESHNQKLSNMRAAQVAALLRMRGGRGYKINAKGYSSTNPVADNGTREGRAQNRRVELSFSAQ